MSIYEYDEEQYRRFLLQEGEERGIEIGMDTKMLELIQKKVIKGKTIETIADELEESIESIRKYYDLIMKYPQTEVSELLSILTNE